MDNDIIRRIVGSHINEVRHCYNEVGGRVSVKFTIGTTGKVIEAELAKSTLPESANDMNTCLATVAKKWRFPKSAGGALLRW